MVSAAFVAGGCDLEGGVRALQAALGRVEQMGDVSGAEATGSRRRSRPYSRSESPSGSWLRPGASCLVHVDTKHGLGQLKHQERGRDIHLPGPICIAFACRSVQGCLLLDEIACQVQQSLPERMKKLEQRGSGSDGLSAPGCGLG